MEDVKTDQTAPKKKKSRKARSLKEVKVTRLKKAALNVLEREINKLLDLSHKDDALDQANFKNLFASLEILNEWDDEAPAESIPSDIME